MSEVRSRHVHTDLGKISLCHRGRLFIVRIRASKCPAQVRAVGIWRPVAVAPPCCNGTVRQEASASPALMSYARGATTHAAAIGHDGATGRSNSGHTTCTGTDQRDVATASLWFAGGSGGAQHIQARVPRAGRERSWSLTALNTSSNVTLVAAKRCPSDGDSSAYRQRHWRHTTRSGTDQQRPCPRSLPSIVA